MRWFERTPALLEDIRESLRAYPTLRLETSTTGEPEVVGGFPVVFEGVVHGSFAVKIKFPLNYPKGLPQVFEVAGRIPHIANAHVNRETGEACLFVPDERWRVWPIGSSFRQFLDGPIRTWFLGQIEVAAGRPWPFGEWAHGHEGLAQYYEGIFCTESLDRAIAFTECLVPKKIKGHVPCPCGSGERLARCHWALVKRYRSRIGREQAAHSLESLKRLRDNSRP